MLEENLRNETKKWLKKIVAERNKVKLADNSKENMLKNIDAYISDSQHFLKKGDLIKSFECVVWAWSWMEILEELKVIKK